MKSVLTAACQNYAGGFVKSTFIVFKYRFIFRNINAKFYFKVSCQGEHVYEILSIGYWNRYQWVIEYLIDQ